MSDTLPSPIVPPEYPDVPPQPGVPPLLRPPGGAPTPPPGAAVSDDAAGLQASPTPPQWGIFLNGQPAITADTVVEFSFRQEYRISDAPQEEGAFVSYNKVQDPFDGRVKFAIGGTVAQRTAFLGQIATAIASLSTGYSLVMPEMTWSSVNVTHQDLRRNQRTATLLQVDVWVEQVRVTGTAQFSNTNVVNPASANPTNDGTVQPQPPTPPQNGAIGTTVLGGSSPPAPAVPNTPTSGPV
jgi:hypothetical protein